MAYSTPTTRADGYVVPASEWNKNTVDNPIALRTGEIALTSQAANDLIIASSASQLGRVAAGTQGQVLAAGASGAPGWVGANASLCQGRLTLTTGTPVTTGDVTAAGTLYWAPYGGNQVALYNGSAWQVFSLSELSISVPASANQMYDVFVDYNAGTPALTLTAWTNDTTRATALTTQNGVLVLTGTLGKRYVGSVRTVTASQLNDSVLLRHVWNYYHRKPRKLQRLETTASWNYTTDTVRQARASTANQVSTVIGVSEDEIELTLNAQGVNDSGNSVSFGIGEGSTTAYTEGAASHQRGTNTESLTCALRKIPAVGYQYWSWNEWSQAGAGTSTFYGTESRGDTISFGLRGRMWG